MRAHVIHKHTLQTLEYIVRTYIRMYTHIYMYIPAEIDYTTYSNRPRSVVGGWKTSSLATVAAPYNNDNALWYDHHVAPVVVWERGRRRERKRKKKEEKEEEDE